MKKMFLIILIFLILLLLISVFFYFVFEVAKKEFSYSIMGMIFSIFWMFEIKNAYKPLKAFGVANPIKGMFHNMGKPQGYKVFCVISLLFFVVSGIFMFIEGVQIICGRQGTVLLSP